MKETESEELTQRHQARQIANEIISFGITEQQKLYVIKYLGEQIEDFNTMKLICWFIDELIITPQNDESIANLRNSAYNRITLTTDING